MQAVKSHAATAWYIMFVAAADSYARVIAGTGKMRKCGSAEIATGKMRKTLRKISAFYPPKYIFHDNKGGFVIPQNVLIDTYRSIEQRALIDAVNSDLCGVEYQNNDIIV